MIANANKTTKPIKVTCKFLRCEKRSHPNKPGRVYSLVFEVIETGDGGPPIGAETYRTVYADPNNLVPAADKKTSLIDTMQKLSPHLHSPEQLISEKWCIQVPAGAVWELDRCGGRERWQLMWLGRSMEANEVEEKAASQDPSDQFDEAVTQGAF